MVRNFNIEISSDYGWEIDIVGFIPPYSDYAGVMDAPMIGVCVKQDNKLIAMYDPFSPDDEIIKEASEHKLFQEECTFTHLDNTFKTTFFDALIYIQKQYADDNVPTLKELQSE